MPSSTTPFSIEDWEPHAVDGTGETSALGRVVFRKVYKGDDLAGTAVATMLNCGQIAYTAMERVTGTLGGRTGSFVLMHSAGPDADQPEVATGVIVAGSGTGDLTGLTGRMEIRHGEDGPELFLEYEHADTVS
ncbi:hypothetical protein GCM10009557_01800 [Virgisporangium ochraceum]|uniref:DUF3224 domain-containing protein n=1 Tax=Virgisporangium ochraceum TaxID=65505 RepID=A0A8J3ZS60_9ACTN|nr:DUF3224 domain-containing protein [Virgisporangium ochraceum]GIJ66530.1 hypothetical protein Voc01_014470 [Virgisporangium ochraceum]